MTAVCADRGQFLLVISAQSDYPENNSASLSDGGEHL